ncbi:MAG: hypothetical protein IJ154_00245 [Bacteroidales bacterium]|nr:hypothetical protein [Bacteroidales bacterium]
MKKIGFMLLCCLLSGLGCLSAQSADPAASIPVNYDENNVGDYRDGLPDLLVFNNGKRVKNARQWQRRRAEILRLFEDNEYGRWPVAKPKLRYDLQVDEGLGGAAIRKQVTLYFSDDNEGPRVEVLVYLPKNAQAASPLLLNLSFFQNSFSVMEPGLKPGHRWDRETGKLLDIPAMPTGMGSRPTEQGADTSRMARAAQVRQAQAAQAEHRANQNNRAGGFGMSATIQKFLEAGFGFATLCYTDITPDFQDNNELGIRGLYHKKGAPRASDDWGSISAWAFGVSYVMDYFEKDPDIDASRIALTGCSRLGKTTLWTGAVEPRIAVVIPSCSGEGGAAMSRRNWGETVAHLTAESRFPYQFCPQYAYWADKVYQMPVDAHMLVALIAPRPLLLQTGVTDNWSDPKGEWLSLVEAKSVYRLLGKDVPQSDEFPGVEQPYYTTLGYVMHDGKHGVLPQDWDYYLEFLKRHL